MNPQPTSYSAVNVLGLIPEELRTRENLEGRELPEDQQEEFMKQCLKEQQQYEEQELKHQDNQPSQQDTPKPATTGINMKVRSISPPGYEDVPDPHHADDDYKNPADTLPGHFMSSSPVKVSPPGGGRKFQIEHRKDAGQDEYTPVFDSLGPGKAERIGEPVIRPRGHSDSSPLVKQFSGDNHSDPTEFNFNTAVLPIVAEGKSSSLPPNSLEDLVEAYSESKRPSSKRNSAKEFVEFDPTTRKGRMESQRKKKPKLNGTVSKNDDNERDSPDGDAKGAESAGSASPVKSKEFEVSGGNMSDSYAVVALVDKKQYRTEADMMKKEGSGKPEHYSASLKRSIKSSAENTSV